MNNKLKTIPKFKNEQEEHEFWQTHDSTKYVDWNQATRAQFPNLKLTNRPITIRLPVALINKIKLKANIVDIPYQSLIKQTLSEHFYAST